MKLLIYGIAIGIMFLAICCGIDLIGEKNKISLLLIINFPALLYYSTLFIKEIK